MYCIKVDDIGISGNFIGEFVNEVTCAHRYGSK
jgi:hypothetical protein